MQWHIQGHTFHFDNRILPLACYDMILGVDWLESVSPMWDHWKSNVMKFTYRGKRSVTLQGVKDAQPSASAIASQKLQGLLKQQALSHVFQLQTEDVDNSNSSETQMACQAAMDQSVELVEQISALLSEFSHLFQEPSTLPPSRVYDHQIPLIPRAQPMNVKPYRYAPQQKTEIERQVQEMLDTGIIQPSVSPFASLVLLVKKKDGTWRFCVDYRQPNNITEKNNYPMPVVDELLDELAGACYFSKLDCKSGYHQIRVAVGDEMKTAFKTHSGYMNSE